MANTFVGNNKLIEIKKNLQIHIVQFDDNAQPINEKTTYTSCINLIFIIIYTFCWILGIKIISGQ